MHYSLSEITVFLCLCLVLIYWWQSRGLKEQALQAALNYCRQMDLELLDQAISLRRLWFKRDDNGTLKAWRSYYFEFTTNDENRYYGRVVMLGNQILKIEVEPHTFH